MAHSPPDEPAFIFLPWRFVNRCNFSDADKTEVSFSLVSWNRTMLPGYMISRKDAKGDQPFNHTYHTKLRPVTFHPLQRCTSTDGLKILNYPVNPVLINKIPHSKLDY